MIIRLFLYSFVSSLNLGCKYNKKGGKVFVNLEKLEEMVKIEVRDTGIGMSHEEIKKLFGEFVRIKNEKTRHILGSGLGLSILKKIVTLYNGEISVKSEPDVGSNFILTLKG